MATKTVNLPVQTRSLDAMPASINEETRTLEVVWTTETPVERWDFWSGERYMEVLDLGDGSVNMERMNTRAPLLDSHTQWGTDGVIGVVERAWLENRQGLAVVRFLKDDERADKVWNKVRQGVLNKISVGYSIEEFEESYDNNVRTLRAVRWTPLEISIVAVPADNDAAVRSADKRVSACVIKTRVNTAKKNKPKQFKRKEHKSMKKRFKREIEDLAPEQVSEVAGIIEDEAEQINTAVEEAVTALDALETEVPAEVTAIVESLAETVDSITTDTETQINEIMEDEEEPPPAAEDETRAAQIMELCDIAGLSAREARAYIRGKLTPQEVSKDLLRRRAAKSGSGGVNGHRGEGGKSAKGFSDFIKERNKK